MNLISLDSLSILNGFETRDSRWKKFWGFFSSSRITVKLLENSVFVNITCYHYVRINYYLKNQDKNAIEMSLACKNLSMVMFPAFYIAVPDSCYTGYYHNYLIPLYPEKRISFSRTSWFSCTKSRGWFSKLSICVESSGLSDLRSWILIRD